MVRPERFELPTYCSGGNRSIQLSYGRADMILHEGIRMPLIHSARASMARLTPVREFYAVTREPTRSPETTRRMLPGVFMLKMIMGIALSLQSETAVMSMTLRPR